MLQAKIIVMHHHYYHHYCDVTIAQLVITLWIAIIIISMWVVAITHIIKLLVSMCIDTSIAIQSI